MSTPCTPCPPECQSVFERLVVSYMLKGHTQIYWTLRDSFADPRPYVFQLQVGQSQNPLADDWTDVGLPVTDMFWAVDGEQRTWGMHHWQYYRVKLTTPRGTYLSEPTGLLGTLSLRDWKLAREALRQERVRMKTQAGQAGFLLKRRIAGDPCPVCLDPQTREVQRPNCEVCHGTGFVCGYFFPIGCVWADLSPRSYNLNITTPRGTGGDVITPARMINTWMLATEDVWVNRVSDDRYFVHAIRGVAEMRGVPLVANVELRLAPASNPIYSLEIPQQLLSLEEMAR